MHAYIDVFALYVYSYSYIYVHSIWYMQDAIAVLVVT